MIWPLLRGSEYGELDDDIVLSERDRQELLDRKGALLAALKEMEFDYRIGKINESDYNSLTEEYKQKAADVLKRLEQGEDELEILIAEARRRVEAEMNRQTSQFSSSESDDTSDAAQAGTLNCPACDTENPLNARFCMNCGAALASE